MLCMATALQGNLTDPVGRLGSRRARTGPPATRHLPPSGCVFHAEHGKLRAGCEGRWTGGRGRPRTTSRCLSAVADGAEESEDGNAVHTGNTPHGEGPSPVEVRRTKRSRRTKDPAHAQAVHARCSRVGRRKGIKHG